MLSERSPPEGQEDPPHIGTHGLNLNINQDDGEESSVAAKSDDDEGEDFSMTSEDVEEEEEEEDERMSNIEESEADETGLEESTAMSDNMTCSSEEEERSESSTSTAEENQGDSDREAGVGTNSTDSEDSDDTGESEEELPVQSHVANNYDRRIPLMEDSVYSMDDGEVEEALTEACRGKTSIVGGAKWEELMAGSANPVKSKVNRKNSSTVVPSKKEEQSVKSSTPKKSAKKEEKPPVKDLNGLMTESGISQISEASDSFACGDAKDFEKSFSCAGLTRTMSLSSCGSKYDARSDGKLSSALTSSKIEYRLDNASETAVAALDDAAREAQLKLLNLHTQLQHYRKMAARHKTRQVLDDKIDLAIKFRILGLQDLTTLGPALPLVIYPLKHDYVAVPGCEHCDVQADLDEKAFNLHCASYSLSKCESSQNALSTAIFRRPGERLCKVFIMREGHIRGRASTVRVVLSSHALYVLNTCPAPALLHALPYTQIHTVIMGAYKDWVVIISRSVVESGGVMAAVRKDSRAGGNTPGTAMNQHVVGVQLCVADPAVAQEFVAYLELQTRRALLASHNNEMRLMNDPAKTPAGQQHFEEQMKRTSSATDISESATECGSRVLNPTDRRRGAQHAGLSDVIEHLVPCVVEEGEWEKKVLEQWLQYLMPVEVSIPY